MKRIVQNFGLHKDADDVMWLVQGRLFQNLNAYKLPSDDCPFEIQNKASLGYHHFSFQNLITDEEKLRRFRTLYKDCELLRFLAPVPYRPEVKCVYIETTTFNDLMTINDVLALNSPTCPLVQPISSIRDKDMDVLLRKLNSSNLSKFAISGSTYDAPRRIDNLVSLSVSITGRLFILGEKRPFYGMEKLVHYTKFDPRLNEALDIMGRNIEAMGATLLREYMLNAN